MDIQNLLNPPEEAIQDTSNDLIAHVTKVYSEAPKQGAKDTPEERVVQPISVGAALVAVNQLLQFEEQQEDADVAILNHLQQVRKNVVRQRLREQDSATPRTLDS